MLTIREVKNGYIMTTQDKEVIGHTLMELAEFHGERRLNNSVTTAYVNGMSGSDVLLAGRLWRNGERIQAVTRLRECYTPPLSLKVAKELLEMLC